MNLVFSIFTKSYIPHVRVLARSIRETNPDIVFIGVFADKEDPSFDPAKETFEIIDGLEFVFSQLTRIQTFKLSEMQLCCSVKPLFAQYLSSRTGIDGVLYLDCDMLVVGDISSVFHQLNRNSIVLFPHTLSKHPPEKAIREKLILDKGVFNAGMFAVSSDPEAGRFLDWWLERSLSPYSHSPLYNYSTEQTWLMLAPALFDRVYIMRDPAYNIARWNFFERTIRFNNQTWICNGAPAAIFHMSRLGQSGESLQRYLKFAPEDFRADLSILCAMYQEKLRAAQLEKPARSQFVFDYFNNGRKIPRILKVAITLAEQDIPLRADPFCKGDISSIIWWVQIGYLICCRVIKRFLQRALRIFS